VFNWALLDALRYGDANDNGRSSSPNFGARAGQGPKLVTMGRAQALHRASRTHQTKPPERYLDLSGPFASYGLSREADLLKLVRGGLDEGRADIRVAVGQRTTKGVCPDLAFASSQRKYLNLNSQCELLRMWPQFRRGQGA
jgi:hypothetical protein